MVKLLLFFLSFSAYSHNILYPVSEDTAVQFSQIKNSALQKRSFFRNLSVSFKDMEQKKQLKDLILKENVNELTTFLNEDGANLLNSFQKAEMLAVATLKGNLEVLKVLLDFKFDPNYYDKFKYTALITAVAWGSLETVRFLLNRSEVSIRSVNESIDSYSLSKELEIFVLMRAVEKGNPEIIRLIHKAGVDFSKFDYREYHKLKLKQILESKASDQKEVVEISKEASDQKEVVELSKEASSQTAKAGLCRRAFSAVKGLFLN